RRPLPPGQARSRWFAPRGAGRPANLDSPRQPGAYGTTADTGGSRDVRARRRARCVREVGGPPAGLATFRRPLGAAPAPSGPFLGDARTRVELRGPPRLALPRLPHPRLQRRRTV